MNIRQIKFNGLFIVFLVYAVIFGLISLVNHYQFRTCALDLGMFNHAMYSFAHFKPALFTLDLTKTDVNYFGAHFDLITILLSPFYYLFGSYALLIVQILAVLFGGLGICKYASDALHNRSLVLLTVIHFFSIWGIYSALSFDFHTNVLGAMLVPWLVYTYEKNRRNYFFLCFVLILISKENMAIWLSFIMIGLVIKQKGFNLKRLLKYQLPLIIIPFVYFLVIVGLVMPAINKGQTQLIRYSDFGGSIFEIIQNIIKNPQQTFSLLFESPVNGDMYFGIKSELHFMVLVSGGFVLLYRPWYLIMLVPIYLQKLLTSDFGLWGINGQYSIEFVPIISLALIDFLRNKSIRFSYSLLIIILCTTLFYTISTMDSRKSKWYDRRNTVFYNIQHYQSHLNLKKIYRVLDTIPKNTVLSAGTNLAPHLAFRDKIYQFPVVKDASYIVVFTSKRSYYPLNEHDFNRLVSDYINSDTFKVEYNKNDLLILKKIKPIKAPR